MEKGTVIRVRPVLVGDRLRVVAEVQADWGNAVEATMPDREVAAILPRSVLLGTTGCRRRTRAPRSLLGTIAPILSRMTEGRQVRMWEYEGRRFFSFLPWKSVRFADKGAKPDSAERGSRDAGVVSRRGSTPRASAASGSRRRPRR